MTRGADWFSFHATIAPIDTVDALQVALADPEQRWYGMRRIASLIASGALVAASWNPNLHPRGRDGQFIDKFGWVRWFDTDEMKFRTGWVSDIDGSTGAITVRSGGEKVEFPNAKNLYSRPKPKALIDLPDPTDPSKLPDKFKKVGGQGGSNPGALYEIDGSFANDPPDITAKSRMFSAFKELRQPGSVTHLGDTTVSYGGLAESAVPPEVDTIMIPRIDGTKGRYEVVQREGNKWYRVPADGQMMTEDGAMRPDLEVTAVDAFGEPASMRRMAVISDLGTLGITAGSAFDVEDVADMVQQTGSQLPGAGDKYYVKKMNQSERARSEALANDFYELLGIPVPQVAVGADGKTISSKIVGDTVPFNKNDPQHIAAVQDGYIADTWTANWDVVGYSFDNVLIDSNGRAWRVDAGGALEYRAQGTPKGAMFGTNVTELDSLRNPKVNANSAKVFGGITTDRLVEQASVLQSISPAEIQALADSHDMGHVGPVMIARRKSILDQLGIIDPAPDIAPPTPAKTTVYNPVEAVQQMGTPPTVAVGNYSMALNALPASTLEPGDWDDTYIAKNAVFRRDGDLWVADSPFSETAGGGHSALLRNLFTGERKQYTLYDGEDEFLDTYTTANVDVLIDNAQPSRDLAVAEIVARTTDLPVAGLDHWKVNLEGDPDGMRYGSEGQINWPTFVRNVERGRLGKDNDRPLMHEDGSLWKVEHAPTHEGDNLILTNSVNGKSVTLNEAVFKATGTWFVASNDTTAAVWQSKFAPVEDHGDADPGGIKQSQDHQIAVAKGELDEFPDQPETPTVGGPGDDGFSDAVEIPTTPTAVDIANDPNLSNLEAEEAIAALQVDEADADLMAASEPTAGSQKLVHGVLAGMSPSEPLLSTEMQVSDLDALKAQLVGKHVVTLPIEAYENPDWEGYDLGAVNGTGTVTDVVQSASGKIGVKVSKPYGGYTWVIGGDASKFPKVVIPVEQAPTIQQVVFKKNGDIFINGTKVGTQYGYKGVIDGDHSITGKAMHFEVKSGKQNLKNAASSLVNPIMPVPTTKKNVKELATETKVKELNLKLEATKTAIAMTEQELADLATGEIVGEGNPLNDGSKPAKGDWVFSVKDGSYAQVLNPNVVGFAGKGVLSPDMIKVKIQDPVTGKWKQSNRKREQLVSAAGPGEPPFVLSTKAILDATGGYIGPGTTAYFGYEGANVLVLDTTTNGHAKVRMSDGSEKWVDASSYLSVASGTPAPSLKAPASGVSDSAKADLLNTQLDALNDEAVALLDTIAATLATPTAKKKQATGTPYPGPDGATFKQPSWLAEQREAQGLKNMKDGYVPAPGMVLRHNDGTQYIVYEMGSAGSSHKNSVLVAPASNPTDTKWRALSTMVVDHEGMLTDKGGNPLPVISQIEGADFAPESGLLISKPYLKSYATGQKDAKGYPEYRQKSIARFFIVGYDGTVYNVDGSKASAYALQPTYNSTDPPERIGYIDKSAPAGKKLTISIQASTHPAQNGYAQYAVIHEPGEDAAIPLAKQAVVQPNPQATTVGPAPPGYVYNPLTGVYEPEPTPTPAAPTPTPTPPAPAVPATPPTAATPSAPYTAPDVTVSPTPTDELPVFTGSSPAGMEVPHPPTTSSAKAVPVFKPTGGPPTLDVTNLAGAHAVTHAIAQATEIAKANKASGKKDWVGTYSLADGDSIEDMMVRVQIVRDKKGVEFVEVSFRLDIPAARKAHTTFMTSSKNEAGDWEQVNRNATNLVPGDKMSLRIASGGGMTPKGGLRPDENGTIPNATVVAAPVLIGKNKAGTLDVYRTQVITAGGDIGFIDVEDRNGEDTLVIFDWDATKPRTTNASKSLNPNAAADGWAVKTHQLTWASSGNWQVSDIESDGVKTMATKSVASAPYSGSTSGGVEFGAGSVLTRDYQDVHIEYATSPVKNSLDGQTVMRVRADDPDAQRKLADAMELVGVTREKQQPPDKEALVKMATTKVWEQFGATYTRGKSPNSPQDALDAIDKAVGTQLGRPATMDDISVRITKDGRVQVLVSEDVSRAVVKKNGVKSYLHQFMGTHKLDMLESIISNESPTLMSTTERFQNGIFITGMSSGKDHKHDSADHLFLTMDKGGNSGTSGSATIDAVTLHRHVDYYYQPGDSYGERQSNQLNWLNSPGHGELMMQRRFEADLITYVRLSDSDRTALIKKLNARGITTAPNGKPLEEFLLDYTPQKFPPTDFGDEITLAALPDTTAAPALAGV